MRQIRRWWLIALFLLCAGCSAEVGQPLTLHLLSGADRQGPPLLLVATQWTGADATFVQLTVWRFTRTGAQAAIQLLLDDWCGRPIQWRVTPDGAIILPAAAATARQDPEAPNKCQAQPARRYQPHGDRFIVTES